MKQPSILVVALLYFAGPHLAQSSRHDGEIPTFRTNEEERVSDYANYFSAYADLYHQKVMLTDHHRMKAYHAAIMGNKDLFRDKVVVDVGTGSGILAVWAAQAGARRVYAIEYTGMAEHATNVVKANGVDHIVRVIRGAAEDVELPLPDEEWGLFCASESDNNDVTNDDDAQRECEGDPKVVDIIISEWMGYFLLRESMLDSVIRIRDKYLKESGLLFPSHATMLLAPVGPEKYRREVEEEYSEAMASWVEYLGRARQEYGVDMACLDDKFEREQKEYYLMSGHWLQLEADAVLATPTVVKTLDMATCTLEDAKGVDSVPFEFDIMKKNDSDGDQFVSGFAGWFTVDFRSRTDEAGKVHAPEVLSPAHLSTGPEIGVTHWGQQVFYLPSTIPMYDDKSIHIDGAMKMLRSQEFARLYNVHFYLKETTADPVELTYHIV